MFSKIFKAVWLVISVKEPSGASTSEVTASPNSRRKQNLSKLGEGDDVTVMINLYFAHIFGCNKAKQFFALDRQFSEWASSSMPTRSFFYTSLSH